MNDIKQQKQDAREHARAHRDQMIIDDTDFEAVVDVFFKEFNPDKNKIISLYWPTGKEFDCRFLLDELVNQEFQCALPVAEKDSRIMTFKKWMHETNMEKGALGILEPQGSDELTPDIVIAPLLAFDQKGYRLGQGGGYYDATIKALRKEKEITYIGLGFAEQAVLFKLPREGHDIPLDYILTPKGIIDFKDTRA